MCAKSEGVTHGKQKIQAKRRRSRLCLLRALETITPDSDIVCRGGESEWPIHGNCANSKCQLPKQVTQSGDYKMKFIYIDESGPANGDIFTMFGIMVDAYRLRKTTADFDALLRQTLDEHPGHADEIKTSKFINGGSERSTMNRETRKRLLRDILLSAINSGGKIFGIAISCKAFGEAVKSRSSLPFEKSYWLASAMFLMCLVQKKMQTEKGGKGLTVAIMDDNEKEMKRFSSEIYNCNEWYDGLYMRQRSTKKGMVWVNRKPTDRFDQIINTAFAIKSNHSSLIQVADAVSYVYRRYIELIVSKSEGAVDEKWDGEYKYYQELVKEMYKSRMKLGKCPESESYSFFTEAAHPKWEL